MELDFVDVLFTAIALLILVIPGFILAKVKVLGQGADKVISNVVLYGCLPFLMFTCFQKYEYSSRIGINMLITFALAVAVHLIMVLLLKFCVKSSDEKKLKVLRFASVFGNCGFMGIPFLQTLFFNSSLLGEMLIYSAVINAVFHVLSWTLGVYLISGDKAQISPKKVFLNPVIIATILGFILFIALKKPLVNVFENGSTLQSIISKIMSSFDMFALSITPLSMTVIGIKIAGLKFKALFNEKLSYANAIFKLIVMPLIVIALTLFLPIDKQVKVVVFLLLAMPTATTSTLFAIKYDGDAEFGAVCVLQSTVLSIITIPLMYLLFNTLLGLV